MGVIRGKGGRVEGCKGRKGRVQGYKGCKGGRGETMDGVRSVPFTLPPIHPSTPVSRTVSVVVIGAGPAGLAAAVQLVRMGIKTIVFEKDRPGGQISTANLVENYLGLYGLPGVEIARLFVRHAMNAGVKMVRADVSSVTGRRPFTVRSDKGSWRARAVVVATGAVPRELQGTGGPVDYDTKDLGAFKGRSVIVLGSGDAAFDRALRIRPVASSVRIICRGKPSALPLLITRCRNAGIPIVASSGQPAVRVAAGRFELRTRKGIFQAERLLASIGKTARTPSLPKALEKLSPAFPDGRTTVPGLWVVGDLASGRDRYLSVATGMGLSAAMAIGEWLKKGKGVGGGR
jgi:thioredoxin reductase (NADPH)